MTMPSRFKQDRSYAKGLRWFAVAVAMSAMLIAGLAASGRADDCCEEECCNQPNKVCRLVCEPETVKEHAWKCECEDFCLPPPSHCCGEKCECDCKSRFGQWCYKIWNPAGCPKLRTRKILVKVEVEKKKPGYHWVVEECCDQCASDAAP